MIAFRSRLHGPFLLDVSPCSGRGAADGFGRETESVNLLPVTAQRQGRASSERQAMEMTVDSSRGISLRPTTSILTAALAAVAAVLVFGPLLRAPEAEARIYWTNISAGTVGSARLDGSGVRKGFIRGLVNPFGLDANGSHLFWADKNRGTIGRARLNGTGITRDFVRIPDWWTPAPIGVTVKRDRIYWVGGSNFISRARIDGRKARPRFMSTKSSGIFGVAANRRHIFWTALERDSAHTVGRSRIDGSGQDPRFITTRKTGPIDVEATGDFVYWVNSNLNTIGRARVDGTHVNPNFIRTGNGVLSAIAVAGCRIYWADYVTGKIGRANLDGTGVRRSLIETGSVRGALRGLAVVP